MPLIKSAIKRMKQNAVRRDRRRPFKSNMKTMIRKVTDLAKEGKTAEIAKILPTVYKSIDTAAKKNIIHKNNAARKKSFVARLAATKK